MSPTAPQDDSLSAGARLALGLAVPAGWLVQDLAVVVTSGRPQDALALAPHSLAVLAGGGAFGLLSGRRLVVPVSLAVTGIWSALPRLVLSG